MQNDIIASVAFIAYIIIAVIVYRASYRTKNIFYGVSAGVLAIIFIFQNVDCLNKMANFVSLVLLLCSVFLIVCFLYSYLSICIISMNSNPTKGEVIRRRKSITMMRFTLALAISFLVVSISYVSFLDLDNHKSPERWMVGTVNLAFFSTMALMLIDGIIARLCSAIYTVEHIKHLEQFNLYLRSFNADKIFVEEEKRICKMFNHLFPTYAIGAPNAVLQPNGAERIYATDSEWQEAVTSLMAKAKIIILRCGLTNGTVWELQKVLSSSYIEKCVFIIDSKIQYDYLKIELQEVGIVLEDSTNGLENSQYGIYLYKDENDDWKTLEKCLTDSSDVESLINEILKHNHYVDAEYAKVLDIRHHSLQKLFSKDIPKKVRLSLNWGIVSPIINMRNWPLYYWAIIIGILAVGMSLTDYIPVDILVYVAFFILFLIGNRIEWTVNPYSGSIMFLKKQRREASLMWFSMLSTVIIAFLCILFTFYYGKEGIL